MLNKHAVVVGAGVGGLAASIRLAVEGFSVSVYEANSFVGGKINSQRFGNYRFDMGPSVFTGPEYIRQLYQLCGEDFASFEYQGLKHIFNYFYPDGSLLRLPSEKKLMIKTLSEFFGEDARVLEKYLKKAERNYQAITPVFIERSLHRFSQVFSPRLITAFRHLFGYKLSKTMHQENVETFDNPKTVQFFDRYATYNGSDPYKAPAMLNMIAHLELNIGPFLPKKGIVQIADSLYELALRQGVQFFLNHAIEEVLVLDGKVTGVRSAQGTFAADLVVSNMDVSNSYKYLLAKEKRPSKTLAQEPSSSAIVFYWGIKNNFEQLGLHNIFFADDYKKEFEAIFDSKTLHDDPTIYVNITSKLVAGDAPPSGENWFVMINAPSNVGQDWPAIVASARKILLNKLSKRLGQDIESLIEVEDVMDPPLIEKKYRGNHGAIYGNASNNRFAAFLRHPNYSKRIKGLYFVGVTVHPGGGIPLAINSAKIALDCIRQDYKLKRSKYGGRVL